MGDVKRLNDDSQRAALADALQVAWNDWCLDTGCIPDGFSIHGPRTTRVEADFGAGNFVGHVVAWLNAKGFEIVLPGTFACRYCGIEPGQELPRPSYFDLRRERDALRVRVAELEGALTFDEWCGDCGDHIDEHCDNSRFAEVGSIIGPCQQCECPAFAARAALSNQEGTR